MISHCDSSPQNGVPRYLKCSRGFKRDPVLSDPPMPTMDALPGVHRLSLMGRIYPIKPARNLYYLCL